VSASDPDIFQQPPTALTYSTTSTVFAIDPNTGQLSVADPAAIDSTTAPSIAVPITVADNGNPPLSTNGTVTVDVVQVPLTASIIGAPTTAVEGTPITLNSVVSDANGQTIFRFWSVTPRTRLPMDPRSLSRQRCRATTL
jgi:Cadherin domain